MAPILLVLSPLVVLLFVLVLKMTAGEHYAPQAYYRRKRGGAPVAGGFESLGPRPRKRPPGLEAENEAGSPASVGRVGVSAPPLAGRVEPACPGGAEDRCETRLVSR